MLKINEQRFLQTFIDLAKIGATAVGGVTRLAFSEEDVAGRAWFAQQVQQAGLAYRLDGAANQSAVWPCPNLNAKTLLTGSHLDTVRNGGRYDGALGVLAAMEAVRTIKEAGLELPVHLEVINFTDEEGSILGEFGSQALTGCLTAAQLASPRGGVAALQAGMTRLGITPETVLNNQRNREEYAGFVEVHIEQGTRLEEAGLDIGVVTSIVGIRSIWLTFTGEAAHAGTKPMTRRRDALWGASEFVQHAKTLVLEQFQPGVVNCGQINLKPGAFNIVPAEVKLALEFRHGDEQLLDEMQAQLLGLAQEAAARNGLTLEVQSADSCAAAPSSPLVVAAIEQAAEALGLKHRRLMSFAGHDTQTMSPFTPSAMIFIPCVAGISHNPHEFSHAHDLVNGANTLLHTLLLLADSL